MVKMILGVRHCSRKIFTRCIQSRNAANNVSFAALHIAEKQINQVCSSLADEQAAWSGKAFCARASGCTSGECRQAGRVGCMRLDAIRW
jgi:hypothetical protein